VPSVPGSTNSRWLAKQGPVPSVPGLTEAGASGGLSVLVSVLKARLLGLRAVLALTRHYREMPHHFPRSY
jgi:hypothetical protein